MTAAARFVVCVVVVSSAQLKLSPTEWALSPTEWTLSPTRTYAQAPARDNVAPAVTGIARITGRVVAADTRNPVARVQVQISSPALTKPRQVTTDADGRYEITGLRQRIQSMFARGCGTRSESRRSRNRAWRSPRCGRPAITPPRGSSRLAPTGARFSHRGRRIHAQ